MSNATHALGLDGREATLSAARGGGGARPSADGVSPAARADSLQKAGNRMILAGFVITVLGVILYCAVCFAAGLNADLGDILFRNTVPFARATLAVMGLGTLVWLVGSFTYLRGAMGPDDAGDEEDGSGA